MMEYVWLIFLFPLLGFFINGLAGHRLPRWAVGLIGTGTVGLSFLLTVKIFLEYLALPPAARPVEKVIYTWITSGPLQVPVAFLIDPLSLIMFLVVSGVSFIIHVYSVGYMHHDPGFPRYFAFLNLFVFAMLTLVGANNFLLMFVGWEGVGLCSYLLIGFWYEKKSAADAGKKAFVLNRVGDCGFILGILLIFWTFGTLNFREIFAQVTQYPVSSGGIHAITLLLFVGACGKSAQLPLYTWLPDAMEGPTPVSALIHAATMVTAGVYMVARLSALYVLAPFSLTVVAAVGALTALYAATIGMAQFDLKRVLAYSTISQLGYMFLACGVGAFTSGIFHLMTHAFFKALLFLGAGSVMHALGGETDLRKMGALKGKLPITYWTFLLASLALTGIFPFAGFFSKDEIILHSLAGGHLVYWGIATAAAFITAFYIFRAVFLTFHGSSRVDPQALPLVRESPPAMTLPLMLLAGLSVVGGWVGLPLAQARVFQDFLAPAFASLPQAGVHYPASLEISLMLVNMLVAVAGIYTAYRMYIRVPELPTTISRKFFRAYDLIYHKFYVDELYDAAFVNPIKSGSDLLWQEVDDKVVDGVANGSAGVIAYLSAHLRKLETGLVQNYALAILLGVVLITGYLLAR